MANAAPQATATAVHIRLRPPSSRERGVRCVAAAPGAPPGELAFTDRPTPSGAPATTNFTFDHIHGEAITQEQVFDSCRHVVDSVLEGYNGTILAYGQTGSGKTHTLIGDAACGAGQGIVPRAVRALGEGIAADASGATFEVRLSVVEIYCEKIRDLLDEGGGRDNLQVKQDPKRGMFVDGATEMPVGSEDHLVDVMAGGLAARSVSATSMNEASSRSHCIVTVTVERCSPDGGVLRGKLSMVDLAGSERQDKTHAAGQSLVEGSQINKSLSALANVIYALTDSSSTAAAAGSTKYVPYRDSKLTRMLQDSLGGNARTFMIVCCSPCADNAAETLCSLRFGSRARGIKTRATVNAHLDPAKLQQQLAAAQAQVAELNEELARVRLAAGAAAGGGSDDAGLGGAGPAAAMGAAPACTAAEGGSGGGIPGWQVWAPWALHALSAASVLACLWAEERWL